jgi:hypothetical protein
MNTDAHGLGFRASSPRPSPALAGGHQEEGGSRGRVVSACPFGAAVCTEWRRRERGECLECWAGVLERANGQSEWLRPA